MTQTDFTAWPVDELTRIFPYDAPPPGATALAQSGWDLAAARGEYVGCQIAVHASGDTRDLQIEVSDLRSRAGTITARNIQTRWVGLVPVPLDAFDATGAERPHLAPGWYPDPLLESPPWARSTEAKSLALHLSISVPARAKAGTYRGSVTVRLGRKRLARIPLCLQVWPFAIPRKPTFNYTNWFHLDCLTKWHRCPPWSERHWQIIDLYAAEMAAHRQNVITTPALTGNFHNFDPMTLVDVTRKRNGTYAFDFEKLQRWVNVFDSHGFAYYEMWHFLAQAHGKHAQAFGLYDEKKKGRVWYDKLSPNSATFKGLVSAFLTELSQWLDRRKLTDRFLLHVYDEPRRETWPHYAKMSKFYREHAPGLRQIDAISTSDLITEFGADLDIPVPLTPHLEDDAYFRERGQAGADPVWWYTCCGPSGRHANRFVSQPLVNGRTLFWQGFAFGVTGYLHWGYNFWHRTGQQASDWPGVNSYADGRLLNPLREHPPQWAVGDAAIVYPHPEWWEDRGPIGSLRYEAVRAGLQDYELLKMLEGLVTKDRPKKSSRQTNALAPARRAVAAGKRALKSATGPIAGSLTDFPRDPSRLLNTRRKVGDAIAALI